MVDADGTTSPRLPSHCVQAALLSAHSPEGASSSPRRGHVTARRRAPGGRGFAASRGTTSRYLDDDDDDDLDDRCEVERRRARPVLLAAAGCRAAGARPSQPGALESRPGGSQRRSTRARTRTRPGGRESQRPRSTRPRTRTRRRGVGGCLVTAAAARSLEGYQSDAPANCSADANVRCSGYSSVLPACHTVTTAVCSARRAVTNVGKSTSLTPTFLASQNHAALDERRLVQNALFYTRENFRKYVQTTACVRLSAYKTHNGQGLSENQRVLLTFFASWQYFLGNRLPKNRVQATSSFLGTRAVGL